MPRKYVAFDIETAKITPGPVSDLKSLRPLGICCAATYGVTDNEPHFWHGVTEDGERSPHMSQAEAGRVVKDLLELVKNGFTIVTWNGLGFDFDILAEESGLREECRRLALGHVDMMFHVVCDRGFPIGLDSVAQGMGLPGKSRIVQQHEVPQFWADGRTDEVLKYLAADVRATLDIAHKCEQQRKLCWITQRGKRSSMPLSSGWLTVEEAIKLPLPDTSWMDTPKPRASFSNWLS